jgi:4-alpha-glucanotransferase
MIAIAPIQDFLNLDNSARMNYPGDPSGNWTWQMKENAIIEELANRIYDINYLYGRLKSLPKK